VLPVAILSGGFARRLYPVTQNIPKSLVEIHGRPFLAWQLSLLRKYGVTRIVLCLGHYSEMIKEFIANENLGLEVLFSEDGATPLGTGGAIQKATPLLGEQFMVLNGDSYLEVNYSDVCSAFIKSEKHGLMTIYKNLNSHENSNIEFRDGAIKNYNKKVSSKRMEYIDFGLSVFSSSAFESQQPATEYDLSVIYEKLLASEQLASFEAEQRFFEIGSHQGLIETTNYIGRLKGNVY
jgi:NDP-sugar pyrophosphorylase family protein